MILMDNETVKISLEGNPPPVPASDSDGQRIYRQSVEPPRTVGTELTISGTADVIWPNREGERFSIPEAFEKLNCTVNAEKGISLCWPATASVSAVGVIDGDELHVFRAERDPEGRARFLSLHSPEPGQLVFHFNGASVNWNLQSFPLQEINEAENINDLYQIGLIGPDGECSVPENRGFAVLADTAGKLKSHSETSSSGNIIHIFGYAEGHDRGYPDYTPSAALGGAEALKSAIEELHNLGFESSLYMNGRLTELSRLSDYPQLRDSVLEDSRGNPVIEEYRGRRFAVMNPSSSAWISLLLAEARKLKELGADWIQLDQIAGRAAPVEPGEVWGAGYHRLIREIQNLGMKVWIQGVGDYYPADAFEATWRPVTILEDGTLRGGCPLGVPDTALIESLNFTGKLIVPNGKWKALKHTGLQIIRDRSAEDDRLPLWEESWFESLIKNNYSRIPGEFNGGIQ